ncbi:MAG: GatB/YqeY domain-containing protein [bacterium]
MAETKLSEAGIQKLLLQFTREKNAAAVSVIKMIKTKVSTEKGRLRNVTELPEPEVLKIVKREMKEIQDTLDSYRKANMPERIPGEEEKLRVLEALLPAGLSDSDLEKIIAEVMAETGKGSFGQTMKAVMARVEGRAEGKRVSELLKKAMAGC